MSELQDEGGSQLTIAAERGTTRVRRTMRRDRLSHAFRRCRRDPSEPAVNARAAAWACAFSLLSCLLASCAPPRQRPVPMRHAPQRMASASRPAAAAPQVVAAAPEPVAVASQPIAADPEPVAADPGPVAAAPEPVAADPEPAAAAPQLLMAAPEPAAVAPAPVVAEPEPVAPTAALPWPPLAVFELALEAYRCGDQEGRFLRPVLTIIDYSLPATEPRLWVVDLREGRVLHHELVAHGEQSGENLAVAFSNRIDSHQSSLGLFRTEEVYTGLYGYALRLSGLEPGINDNARARAIVFHGSSDVSPAFAAQWGTIGRSWGCPALPEDSADQVIDYIAGGSAVFAYYPDTEWLRDSRYLHCDAQLADGLAAVSN